MYANVCKACKQFFMYVNVLPDVSEFTKGDHDWYCFQCHEGGKGPVVACEDCPRIFHLDCLPDDRKPQKDLFVCPPCHVSIGY